MIYISESSDHNIPIEFNIKKHIGKDNIKHIIEIKLFHFIIATY